MEWMMPGPWAFVWVPELGRRSGTYSVVENMEYLHFHKSVNNSNTHMKTTDNDCDAKIQCGEKIIDLIKLNEATLCTRCMLGRPKVSAILSNIYKQRSFPHQ